MDDDILRAMPHALGVEKALISMMLQNNLVQYPRFVEAGLSFDMFYLPAHVKVGSIISEYTSKNISIEMIGFMQSLIDAGRLAEIGGPAAVTELFSYAINDGQFDNFCEKLRCKFIARQLIMMNDDKAFNVDGLEDINSILSEKEAKLSELSALLHPKSSTTVKQSILDVFEEFKHMITCEDPKELYGLLTGFETLDKYTMGLKAGDFFVIGARPSVGKSSVLFNMLNTICVNGKKPSLVFSCEMNQVSVIKRMVYSMAKIQFHKLAVRGDNRYIPSKQDLIRMQDASIKINEAPLYVEDKGGISIEDLKTTARRHKRLYDIEFIGVDYLQLVRSNSRKAMNSTEAEVSEISASLKALAKELKLPIVCLSQLNRESAKGSKLSKPKMNELRSSGSIEQDADLIGLLHRYDYDGNEDRKGEAELNLAKNRNGPTGIIHLEWITELTQFTEKPYQPPT